MAGIIELCEELKEFNFKEKMITPEECLMFSQLAYIPFERIDIKRERKLGIVLKEILATKEPSISIGLTRYFDIRLMNVLKDAPRYKDIKVLNVKILEDDKKICQFGAVTFSLDDGIKVISYRGTLNEVFAWNESLNLSFKKSIPSHELGLKYLEETAKETVGSLIITGHSKGGNIAMYSALESKEETKNRIKAVYNFDGPGFNDYSNLIEDFKKIGPKITTYLPQSSIVGILLNHEEEVKVIKSRAFQIMQHDPYSIIIEKGSFIELKELSNAGKTLDIAMRKILNTLTQEETQGFVDTLFKLIYDTEEAASIVGKINIFFSKVKELEDEERENFNKVIDLYRNYTKEAEKELPKPNIIKNINETMDNVLKVIHLKEENKEENTDKDIDKDKDKEKDRDGEKGK